MTNEKETLHSAYQWIDISLHIIKKQRAIELNAAYDRQASLMALALVENWVLENVKHDKTEYLMALSDWYLAQREILPEPGEYNGGLGTFGGCVKDIIRENYPNEPIPKEFEPVFLPRNSTKESTEARRKLIDDESVFRTKTNTTPSTKFKYILQKIINHNRSFNAWGNTHPYLAGLLIIIIGWSFGFSIHFWF